MRWNKLEVECIEVGKPDVTIYRLSGGLTGSAESYQFLEDLRKQTRKHPSSVVINLEQVEHVSSAGVGILAACYTSATNADKRLCLSHVSNRVRMILDVVKISDVLCIFETEKEAVEKICK